MKPREKERDAHIQPTAARDIVDVRTLESSCAKVTVRPFHGMWEVFELPGIQPLFSTRDRAIQSARGLLKGRPGVIEVRDGDDLVEEVIDLRPRSLAAQAA